MYASSPWQCVTTVCGLGSLLTAKEPDENGHFSDSGDDRDDDAGPVFHSGRMMTQDELRVSRLRSALVQLTDVYVFGITEENK